MLLLYCKKLWLLRIKIEEIFGLSTSKMLNLIQCVTFVIYCKNVIAITE